MKELRDFWSAEFGSDTVLQECGTWFSQMKFISMKTSGESIKSDTRAYAVIFHFGRFRFVSSFCFSSILWPSFCPGSTASGGKPGHLSTFPPDLSVSSTSKASLWTGKATLFQPH